MLFSTFFNFYRNWSWLALLESSSEQRRFYTQHIFEHPRHLNLHHEFHEMQFVHLHQIEQPHYQFQPIFRLLGHIKAVPGNWARILLFDTHLHCQRDYSFMIYDAWRMFSFGYYWGNFLVLNLTDLLNQCQEICNFRHHSGFLKQRSP